MASVFIEMGTMNMDKLNLLQLGPDLLLRTFQYLDDVDLQELAKVHYYFDQLYNNPGFRHYVLLNKNLARINKELSIRAQRQDLINRNILKGGNTHPSFFLIQDQLQLHLRRHSLSVELQRRPDIEQLRRSNLLPDGKCSPRLVMQQRLLQRHLAMDQVSRLLRRRLRQHENALHDVRHKYSDTSVTSQMQPCVQRIFLQSLITRHLKTRPSIDYLTERRVLPLCVAATQMHPRINDRIAFFEHLSLTARA